MNFPSVSNFSIAKGTGGTNPPELYVPLWWYSGSYSSVANASSGSYVIVKGTTTSAPMSTSSTNQQLHTLNANWNPSQKYAFEVTLANTGNNVTSYCALYDYTANAIVSASQASVISTTFTVVRSGQFTLIPGHKYGVTFWDSQSSYNAEITDASLIVFPQ